VFLAILGSVVYGSSVRKQPEGRPNIIFLLTDDQRWDALGAAGDSVIHTPNLDRLASQGIIFENAFVTTSICATSRASIITGQYARRHGVWDFQTSLSSAQLTESYLGILRAGGYRLGFIGKWGVGTPPAGLFDYSRAFGGQGKYFVESDGETRHLTSIMGDQAVEFLGATDPDTPFCLSVSFKAPHVQDSYDLSQPPFPFDPALEDLYEDVLIESPTTSTPNHFSGLPAFLKNSENRMRWAVRFWGPKRYQESVKGYYRLITGVDTAVGRILEQLKRRGLDQNTVVIFTSDNGFFLGEYGLAGKWLPYEASIRVPLVVFDPRSDRPAAGRRSQMALNIDVAPTIIDLAGLQTPLRMQGRSLLPLIEKPSTTGRTDFLYEHLFEHPRIPPVEALRTSKRKYVRYLDPDREELYNLESDPFETVNRASEPQYQDELRSLQRRLTELRKSLE
jgi:arylsulfatase A-like enzyme